jgi:spore cortex formation protein SpoVR/YcgB (stage V sporulation)
MTYLYKGTDWDFNKLYTVMDACEDIAINDLGLDCYPNQIEIITVEQMLDSYSSVGMPMMYNHWSFGKSFLQNQHKYDAGQMGLAYELVINSNPCINYLMEENSMTTQALVIAHAAFGHNHFFKNNYMFQEWTDADAIIDYLSFAKKYIADCEQKYGYDAVDEILTCAHMLQYQSVDKYKRPYPMNPTKEREKQLERAEYLQKQVNDLWRTVPVTEVEEEKKRRPTFPETPEENLLYFLEKHSPVLKPWERELCRIVRKMAQYFYPQYQTKVMNEGFASFTHHYIMNKLYDKDLVDDGAMLEFNKMHAGVLFQPEFDSKFYSGMNPYALGFAILRDIRRVCETPDDEDYEWFPDIAGTEWRPVIRDIAANYRDESAIRQFLGPKVMRDWKMFTLEDKESESNYKVGAIHNEQGFKRIRKALADSYETAAMIPDIQIHNADIHGDRTLYLKHHSYKERKLNKDDAESVLESVKRLWGYEVDLTSSAPGNVSATHLYTKKTRKF